MGAERSYDADLALWAEDQAHALRDAARSGVNLPIDWENVAEEIESLGKAQRGQLANRIVTILLHLMKLQASPSVEPRAGWRDTIAEQRDRIGQLLEEAPSLRPAVGDMIAKGMMRARRLAAISLAGHREEPLVDLAPLTYTEQQVLGDWFPDEG